MAFPSNHVTWEVSRAHWTEKKTETPKGEAFAQGHSVRRWQNWDSYTLSASPRFCLLSAKLHCFPRKRREEALAVGKGLSRSCLSLGRRAERGPGSHQITGSKKAGGEVRASGSHATEGQMVEQTQEHLIMLFVRQQEKPGGEKSWVIRSLFHGLCCLYDATCQRENVIHVASLWGR